jgi:hypothetical protein
LNSQAIEKAQIAPAVLWYAPCSYSEGKLWFVVLPAARKFEGDCGGRQAENVLLTR